MNKRNSIIFILFFLLCIAAFFVYKTKSGLSTVHDDDSRNFKFKDTASITKIFLADKQGNQSILERTAQGWIVNGKFACRAEAILNLLEVIRNVEVKMSVPLSLQKTVIKFMSTSAIKVEIYCKDELVKQYYVGHETDDSESSYMLLTDIDKGKNYENPYACFIPGFKGFLQPRYIVNENDWRDRVVMNFTPPQIKQISIKNYLWPDSSFSIEVVNTTHFKLKNKQGVDLAFDEAKLKQYLFYFQNISYEGLISNRNKKLQDSLILVKPFASISITTQDYKNHVYEFYRKQFVGDVNPELGITYKYDPDRLFMNYDNRKEWALIQYFVFGKLLINQSYFLPQNSVKK